MSLHRKYAGETPEGTTPPIAFTIRDPDGNGFLPDTLILTLYDEATKVILGGREKQNVRNANGVTVSAAGEVVWQTVAADNAIVTDSENKEKHVALFEWTWDGSKHGKVQVVILVRNLAYVP